MTAVTVRKVNLRSIALPAEHGGWGFLIEPMLLGLLVAPTWQAAVLCISMFGFFLVHQPLKLAAKDHQKGRRIERTIYAERFAIGYALVGILALLIVAINSDPVFLIPYVVAVPMVAVQLYYDARNQSRAVVSEIAGGIALGSTATAIAIIGGLEMVPAFILWVLLAARVIPAIIYVRARLCLEKGKEWEALPVWLSHAIAAVVILALLATRLTTWWAVLAIGILTFRALKGISKYRKPVKPSQVGISEMALGFLTAVLYALA
ncbi:MAG: YwiC-like family protein [Chloroflexi bacterium]|nr:YwiC-like family protein [Chloroflexota bacterium]